MPTFDFSAPDGKQYSVEGPEGATAEQAFSILQQQIGAQKPQVGIGEDIVKSIPGDLASMATGTLGMPGDIGSLISKGVDYAGSKLGVSPDKVQQFKDLGKRAPLGLPLAAAFQGPTSEDLQSKLEGVTGKLYEPQTGIGKTVKTGVEFLPAMLGGPETLAAKFATRVAAPAVGSELASQATDGNPYAKLAGAVTGPSLLGAARRLVTPLPATAARTALANTLEQEGVPLTAGQRTGSKPLQWMESALGDTVGSGGPAARAMENQAEQFTSAALNRAGVNAQRATPDVIDNAFRRIGGDFQGVAARNNVQADNRLGTHLQRVEGEYNNVVSPSNRAPVIENTIRDVGNLMAQNGGHMTGEQYNAITSRLARQARGAKADPQLSEALQGIRSALDDAMERTLFRTNNLQDMQVLRTARNQYRNLLVLEKSATGAGSGAAEGLISPSQLRNAVVQQGRRAYGRGQGDFADLARAGEALLKPLPQSGTSPRHNVTHLLHTVGAVVGGGAGAVGGPAGSVAGALAGLAAPAVAGRALLSRPMQAYLSNQLLNGNLAPSARQRIMTLLLAGSANEPALLQGSN